jgi:hypothetical protein
MKRYVLTSLGATVVAIVGCQQGGSDSLVPHQSPWSQNSLADGLNNTWNHLAQSIGGENGITDPTQKLQADDLIGTPDVVARLHGAQKIQYASLGLMLTDMGVDVTSMTADSAGDLYQNGQSPLGVAVYASRTPEMIIPSTSALAKQYDIFVAAAADIVTSNLASSTRCPGVELITNGQFTSDGITCLLGKPATASHVTLANQLVAAAPDPATGQQIAVATLLAAAHVSE